MRRQPTFRELRKAAGLTQKELGQRFGYATDTVRAFESGKRQPRAVVMDALKRMAKERNA